MRVLIITLIILLQVLGTPTREQIREMNPNYTEFKFPQIKSHPWAKVTLFSLFILFNLLILTLNLQYFGFVMPITRLISS